MIDYYLDKDTKELDPDLLDGKAIAAAESFFTTRDALKSSQLRKFYADVKTLERQYQAAQNEQQLAFARILPMIKLLKAKSEYALKRKVVPASFKDWLWENVDSINDASDFRAFLLHFEAVVGFSARYTKD